MRVAVMCVREQLSKYCCVLNLLQQIPSKLSPMRYQTQPEIAMVDV